MMRTPRRSAILAAMLVTAAAAITTDAQTRPAPPGAALNGVPVFKVDPKWPVLPADWTWGQVIGIFADSRGHVWNGEFVKEKILRVRCGPQEQATWAPKRTCGTEAAFSIGFSHDAPQTYLYVADGGSHFITILRRSDLEIVDEFGGPGVGPGQLGRPHNLSVDPSGNIFSPKRRDRR